MRKFSSALLAVSVAATPAFAASGPFFSLRNTDFVVLIGFILFIAILVYFKVPGMITGMLDDRSKDIRSQLDEARKLRDEARELLASYERKQREVQDQADRIVAAAKEESELAAAAAREDLKKSIARRMAAADEQIASAEAAAVREVRDRAVNVAVEAARAVIAQKMTEAEATAMIESSIAEVDRQLH